MDYNSVIKKLASIKKYTEPSESVWENWTVEEKRKLLDLYLLISRKESHIFKLIYSHHGEDSWEDIFRDYDDRYLKEKTTGVEIAWKECMRIENGDSDDSEYYSDSDSSDE